MGLKRDTRASSAACRLSLNRTSVGLKRRRGSGSPGIRSGLNRTSVGLKRGSPGPAWPWWSSPQSNQRGIETALWRSWPSRWRPPQSNQRGIETGCEYHSARAGTSLNRTSVGLKPIVEVLRAWTYDSLNRTSVGLKPHHGRRHPHPVPGPQSNQRGIETGIQVRGIVVVLIASIEPAWD